MLYQLAYEHFKNSPITKQAEYFLNKNRVDWTHFKLINREVDQNLDPNILTLKGHHFFIDGVILFTYNKVISWAYDFLIFVWDLNDGTYVKLEGHDEEVAGVLPLSEDKIISWSYDKTLRLWDLKDGSSKVFKGHKGSIRGAYLLKNNQILSWSYESIFIWNLEDGDSREFLVNREGWGDGNIALYLLENKKAFACSKDGMIRLWNFQDGSSKLLKGHTDEVTCIGCSLDGNFIAGALTARLLAQVA